ncbi:hypothetical protein AeRB84_002515 [Aphanomyces euteiches]|nr:hypothetical protein AeRB84_002515 [Aphanomyces euteiches]
METDKTMIVGGVWPCPYCEERHPSLPSLRSHIDSHHRKDLVPTSPKVSQKLRLMPYGYLTKVREMHRHAKQHARSQTFNYMKAAARGSFQCKKPLVKIQESTIPGTGFGLFAAIKLIPGDRVTWFDGQVDLKAPRIGCGLGTFIKRCNRQQRENCELEYTPRRQRVLWVVVTETINAGQELMINMIVV